ncbi:MAG: HAD hydrolase-like protein [Bacteroidales bacterium]|nr:HAD hydrolase-like protein [Bacteroidales bacterium]
MVRFDTVLFDLDGTLTDPSLGITNSIMHALAKRGITVAERSSLYKFIGPPLLDSFQKYCGFSEDESKAAVADYREYFSTRGLFENSLLDGCEETLQTLKDAGCRLVLCTSKPEPYALRILEHFGLLRFFCSVWGATMDGRLSRKDEIMAEALKDLPAGCTPVMVGDRHHDIDGACANGIPSIGVLCGFGSEKELRDSGASFVVRGLRDILPVVIEN